MRRELLVGVGVLCFLLTDVLVGQSAIAIRAAATSPVSGWQQMPSPDRVGVLWVAPADALTSEDIARAEQVVDSNGFPALTL